MSDMSFIVSNQNIWTEQKHKVKYTVNDAIKNTIIQIWKIYKQRR